jgi:phytanoyl-CoA hydroxylase
MRETSAQVENSAAGSQSAPRPPGDRFSADELAQFDQAGFVTVRGLADDETCRQMIDCTRQALAGAIGPAEFEADLLYPGAPGSRAAAGGDTVRRLKEAHGRHPVFSRFLSQPSLVQRLTQLLGRQVVMPLAHHNCIMTKQPRYSSETHWHQDIRYWSYERPELVSVWLALGHETPDNGCLYLIPGTHEMSFSPDRFDAALFLRADRDENAALIERKLPAVLQPGDVLFFHCRTFHAAGRNQTGQTKFSVVFTFRPGDNPPKPGSRSASMPELVVAGADR